MLRFADGRLHLPHLAFASPRLLPKAEKVAGRVVVLDIAFAATVGTSVSFELDHQAVPRRSRRPARGVGRSPRSREARAVRARSAVRAGDEGRARRVPRDGDARARAHDRTDRLDPARTSISTACTRRRSGSSAASSRTRAPTTTRARSTRAIGTPGPIAMRIDRALRAKFRDDQLKRAVVQFLVGGMKPGAHDDVIAEAAAEFERTDAVTQRAREAVHDPRPRRGRRHRRARRASSTRPTCCSRGRRRRRSRSCATPGC